MSAIGIRIALLLSLALFLLPNCTHWTAQEREAGKALSFAEVIRNPAGYKNSPVIWGGRIVDVLNKPGSTEMVVLQSPLESGNRPGGITQTEGRFLAVTCRYIDPAIYEKGTKVTVSGEIVGEETRLIGELPYTYPVVMIREARFWTERSRSELFPYWAWYEGPWLR